MPKTVLTIAGSDPCCGAGVQADLKTIMLLGGYGACVITALTAQNTCGIYDIYEIPATFVGKQIDTIASDIDIASAKTGMLLSATIVNVVADRIRKHRIKNLVVDPVISAKDGKCLLDETAIKAVISQLIPLAYLITPNIPEAGILTGQRIRDYNDMKLAAMTIKKLGVKNVLIKGGHLADHPVSEQPKKVVDILYNGRSFEYYESEFIPTRGIHGTGCVYSAAIATGLAKGNELIEAVRLAKDFISAAIKETINHGKGYALIDHCQIWPFTNKS